MDVFLFQFLGTITYRPLSKIVNATVKINRLSNRSHHCCVVLFHLRNLQIISWNFRFLRLIHYREKKNCECCPRHSLFKGHYECWYWCSQLSEMKSVFQVPSLRSQVFRIGHWGCSLNVMAIVYFGQVMSPHHSDQMSQRSQVSGVALWGCFLNVLVIVFVFVFVIGFVFVIACFVGQVMSPHLSDQMSQRS